MFPTVLLGLVVYLACGRSDLGADSSSNGDVEDLLVASQQPSLALDHLCDEPAPTPLLELYLSRRFDAVAFIRGSGVDCVGGHFHTIEPRIRELCAELDDLGVRYGADSERYGIFADANVDLMLSKVASLFVQRCSPLALGTNAVGICEYPRQHIRLQRAAVQSATAIGTERKACLLRTIWEYEVQVNRVCEEQPRVAAWPFIHEARGDWLASCEIK